MATRKAEQEAEIRRISQIGDFKTRLGGIQELPSGLVVKVRNPGGLQAFMGKGQAIPNSLMSIIEKGMKTGQAPKPDELFKDGKMDQDVFGDMVILLDNIALKTIVEPRIWPRLTDADVNEWNKTHPDEPVGDIEDLRSDEKLYADELPDDDKQFLFQWISGGTRDLETFRAGLAQSLDSVVAVAGNRQSSEPDSGTNAG